MFAFTQKTFWQFNWNFPPSTRCVKGELIIQCLLNKETLQTQEATVLRHMEEIDCLMLVIGKYAYSQ